MLRFASISDSHLAHMLQRGSVGIIPTDTIYGLAASAHRPEAVRRLYALKDREHKPGTVVAGDVRQLIELGLDERALRAVAHLWPNPLSIIIAAPDSLEYLHQDVGSLAVRIPRDDDLRALLLKTGPLVTSSVNHPGEPPANNLVVAESYFGNRVDFYADGGDRSHRPPSTVARIDGDNIEVLRPGAVTINKQGEVTYDL